MTIQTKHFIDLHSILSLRLRCNKCQIELLLPLSKEIWVKRLRACPNCDNAWTTNGSSIEPAIEDAIASIKKLARLLNGDFPVGFSLTLEIEVGKSTTGVDVP